MVKVFHRYHGRNRLAFIPRRRYVIHGPSRGGLRFGSSEDKRHKRVNARHDVGCAKHALIAVAKAFLNERKVPP